MRRFIESLTSVSWKTGFLALVLAVPAGLIVWLWNSLAPADYETRECSVVEVFESHGTKNGSDSITLETIDCGGLTFHENADFQSREDMVQYINHKIRVQADRKTGYANSVTIDPDSIEVIK